MNKTDEAGMRSLNKGCIPVLVIMAPTASGKTELLEKAFASDAAGVLAGKAEVINADSMQVYKGMDAGTAKPDAAFLKRLPHHLIDLCTPDHQFGSGEFLTQADAACADIFSRGKLPVLCGGTSFYLKAFLYGLPPTPEADLEIREKINRRMQDEGAEALWKELFSVDPESAEKIHINDEYRIKRALEVYYTTGKKRSDFAVPEKEREPYRFFIVELRRPREELYQRINLRVDRMFENGLAEEAENLIKSGCTADMPGMQAIGYREFFAIKRSSFSEDESGHREYLDAVKELIKKDTRKYAKKQQTFIKAFPEHFFIHPDNFSEFYEAVKSFYERFYS